MSAQKPALDVLSQEVMRSGVKHVGARLAFERDSDDFTLVKNSNVVPLAVCHNGRLNSKTGRVAFISKGVLEVA